MASCKLWLGLATLAPSRWKRALHVITSHTILMDERTDAVHIQQGSRQVHVATSIEYSNGGKVKLLSSSYDSFGFELLASPSISPFS